MDGRVCGGAEERTRHPGRAGIGRVPGDGPPEGPQKSIVPSRSVYKFKLALQRHSRDGFNVNPVMEEGGLHTI